MDFWPRDQRTKTSKSTSHRRKTTAKEQSRSYPHIERGLLGAATLVEDDSRRLNWAFVSKISDSVDESLQKRLRLGKQIQVFPSTCPPPSETSKTSIKQRAEKGANFLRTYLPDIEIPEELIRGQLIDDTTRTRELLDFDPYSGDIIDVFMLEGNKDTLYSVFPTGETKRDLSYASIAYSDPPEILFKPSGTYLHRFLTPIQHIVSSNGENTSSEDTKLVVRTYSSTQLFNVQWDSQLFRPILRADATLARKDLNNEIVIDMQFMPHSNNALMTVGDRGSVFMCNTSNDSRNMPLYTQREYPSSDSFWRLACSNTLSDYFLMDNKKVWSLDTRTDAAVDFFTQPAGKHVLTSIENCHANNILSLCSTSEIIWMDIRFPRNPLLAYAHGRQFDRYIRSHTLRSTSNDSTTILTSRNNNLMTAYSLSLSPNDPIRFKTLPYCLPSDYSMYQTHIGQQVVTFDKCTAFLRMSETEGVIYNELLFSELEPEISYVFERTDDMKELVNALANPKEETGPFSCQEYSEVNLQAGYEAMFREHFNGTEYFEEQNAEAADEMLDYFPSYLMSKEIPTEHLLTTYDITFRAGEESNSSTKATYLTESLVQSKRGYDALKRGELSPKRIKAPFHRSILPTLQKFDKTLSADLNEMGDHLRGFALSDDVEHSSQIRQYEEDSAQQLIMDLALSFDVFSDTPISKRSEADQTLENLTEALSLGDEPPPIEFGYLKPLKKKDIYTRDEENRSSSAGLDIPLGVRSLLQNWDTSDPESYEYQDPYNAVNEPLPVKFRKTKFESQSQIPMVQSQRPPVVLTSNAAGFSQPDLSRRTAPRIQTQSQVPMIRPLDTLHESLPSVRPQYDSSQSQEMMASTQILPGLHGGRPVGKKKPQKKRLGGF